MAKNRIKRSLLLLNWLMYVKLNNVKLFTLLTQLAGQKKVTRYFFLIRFTNLWCLNLYSLVKRKSEVIITNHLIYFFNLRFCFVLSAMLSASFFLPG